MTTMKTPNRQDWKFGNDLSIGTDIISDKKALISQYYTYMLDRTRRMFEYSGIDEIETLDIRRLEQLTQVNSYCFLVNVKNPKNGYPKGIYALNGFLGGLLDPNGIGTKATINNVALGFNEILDVGKDCILYYNDSTFTGLDPVFSLYANLLADVDISLRFALVNSRIPNLYNGSDSQSKEDLNSLYKDIDDGKAIAPCIITNPFFDGLKNAVTSASKEGLIKELIEAKQYLMSNWFIFLGLQSNYNMKREAINESESGMNEDSLIPLVDDMLNTRKECIDKANKLFGTNIGVELSSAWKKVHTEYKENPDDKTVEETSNEDMKDESKEEIENENE